MRWLIKPIKKPKPDDFKNVKKHNNTMSKQEVKHITSEEARKMTEQGKIVMEQYYKIEKELFKEKVFEDIKMQSEIGLNYCEWVYCLNNTSDYKNMVDESFYKTFTDLGYKFKDFKGKISGEDVEIERAIITW